MKGELHKDIECLKNVQNETMEIKSFLSQVKDTVESHSSNKQKTEFQDLKTKSIY
jgi:hypothetical protein